MENTWIPIAAAFIINPANFYPHEMLSPLMHDGIKRDGLLKLMYVQEKYSPGDLEILPRLNVMYTNYPETKINIIKFSLN